MHAIFFFSFFLFRRFKINVIKVLLAHMGPGEFTYNPSQADAYIIYILLKAD